MNLLSKPARIAALSLLCTVGIGSYALAEDAPQQPSQQAGQQPSQQPATETRSDDKNTEHQMKQQLDMLAQEKDGMAGDKLFVLQSAVGGKMEVAASQQAAQKSQSAEVKKIAQQMIQDHETANRELEKVAQNLQLQVPTELPYVKRVELQILGNLDGQAYDRAFLGWADAEHAHDVTCFRNEAQFAQNPEVKAFATQTLPVLQGHWKMIREAGQTVGLPEASAAPAHSQTPSATAVKQAQISGSQEK